MVVAMVIGGVSIVVIVATVLVTALRLWTPMQARFSRAPDVTDSRACRGSNVGLGEVTAHFGLALPGDATDVRFYSDVHPMFGEYTLSLRFTTTPSGLSTFLRDTAMTPVQGEEPRVDGAAPADCAGEAAGAAGQSCASDPDSMDGSQRSICVDLSDPQRPRVLVEAMDV